MNIRLEKVRISYNDNVVIDDIDALFLAKEINFIIGSSGSGKSTLLRSIGAFEDPQSGTIYYDKDPHYRLLPRDIRANIGMIFQKPTLFEGSVYDNLIFWLRANTASN